MTNKNIIDYTFDNALEHIRECIYEARKNCIEANTIILNKEFAMTNNLMFHYTLNDIYHQELYPPMLFGLQVRYQSEPLPNNANFVLFKTPKNKMEKINDLEEELGIDILTLFRAINEGIWLIDHLSLNEFDYFKRPRLYYSDDYKCYCFELALGGYVVKLKDYGKTWALTREGLEEDD